MREIRSLLPRLHTFIRGLGMKLSTATSWLWNQANVLQGVCKWPRYCEWQLDFTTNCQPSRLL